MNEDDVRSAAEAVCTALVAGDVDAAIGYLSEELHRNLGEVVALLPLPALEATITSVEHGGPAFVVVVHVIGETHEVDLQTRWKDRDGKPRIIEVSHLSEVERAAPDEPGDAEGDAEPAV